MIFHIDDTSRTLADILASLGRPLDLRCGGNGICGRCTVKLLTGFWQVGQQCVKAPAEARACKTRLLSANGDVDVPQTALAPDDPVGVLNGWQNLAPFRQTAAPGETVIAIDIGTTTLAAAALRGGDVIARASRYNPQARFGDNVMSRISAAKYHLTQLRNELLDAMRAMLADFPTPARIAVAANATMTTIFHGINPEPIGHAPFILPKATFDTVSADCLGFPGDVPLLTVPLISAFLGGDILAGLHETQPQPGDIFVDIGTNCEMVLCNRENTPPRFTGTAAAAGPAFEGAGLQCGARAVKGAICHYDGPGRFTTIQDPQTGADNAPKAIMPSGCCGSALVDFLAVERASGRLNRFGRFRPQAENALIAPGIAISEADIEQLLKAKAAVFAGIAALEKHTGTPCSRLILAGGFAQYLNLERAAQIAMLPKLQARIVGNASLAGALRLAANPGTMHGLLDLRTHVRDIPLNTIPDFEDAFIQGLQLP